MSKVEDNLQKSKRTKLIVLIQFSKWAIAYIIIFWFFSIFRYFTTIKTMDIQSFFDFMQRDSTFLLISTFLIWSYFTLLDSMRTSKSVKKKNSILLKFLNYESLYDFLTFSKFFGLFQILAIFFTATLGYTFFNNNYISLPWTFVAIMLLFIIPSMLDVYDNAIIYLTHYLKYGHNLKDLKQGFDYVNDIFKGQLNKERIDEIINTIYAYTVFHNYEYDEALQEYVEKLKTKDLEKLIPYTDTVLSMDGLKITIRDIVKKVEPPLTSKISKYLIENWISIISLPLVADLVIRILSMMYRGT